MRNIASQHLVLHLLLVRVVLFAAAAAADAPRSSHTFGKVVVVVRESVRTPPPYPHIYHVIKIFHIVGTNF